MYLAAKVETALLQAALASLVSGPGLFILCLGSWSQQLEYSCQKATGEEEAEFLLDL